MKSVKKHPANYERSEFCLATGGRGGGFGSRDVRRPVPPARCSPLPAVPSRSGATVSRHAFVLFDAPHLFVLRRAGAAPRRLTDAFSSQMMMSCWLIGVSYGLTLIVRCAQIEAMSQNCVTLYIDDNEPQYLDEYLPYDTFEVRRSFADGRGPRRNKLRSRCRCLRIAVGGPPAAARARMRTSILFVPGSSSRCCRQYQQRRRAHGGSW